MNTRRIFAVMAFSWTLASGLNADVLSISPAAIRPSDSLASTVVWHAKADAFYFETYAEFEVNIGVELPHGVQVSRLSTYLTDLNSTANNIWISLRRQRLTTGVVEVMASISTMDKGSLSRKFLTTSTIAGAVIDNTRYTYHLKILFDWAGSDRKIHGLKIHY